MIPSLDRVPQPWLDRFKRLGATGDPAVKAVVLVGGCVRDMMLGRPPFDWDVMVEGRIDPVLRAAEGAFHVDKTVRHPAFLTSTVHFHDGTALDVVTARTETYAKPAALPAVRAASLKEDFRRRDFTVNAMAMHISRPRWGDLEDPFDGRSDLDRGWVRVLHERSFRDDPTRLYRAARYAGRYGWIVESGTRSLVEEALKEDLPALLSPVRRRNELSHLLNEPDAAPAMKLLWDWGMWKYWSPSFRWTAEVAARLSAPAPDLLSARLAALCRSGDRGTALNDLRALSYPRALIAELSRG